METLFFVFRLIVHLFCVVLLLRLLLQLVQADFYNPLSQTIFKISAPVIEPFRKIFPTIGSFNTAALVVALFIQWIFFLALGAVNGLTASAVLGYLAVAAFQLLNALIDIYFYGIFIIVIASWVGTLSHPTVRVVSQVMEPYLAPFRRIIPPIGMIDISPMVAILVLIVIRQRLLPMLGDMLLPLFN